MVAIGSDRFPIEWRYPNLDRELAQERDRTERDRTHGPAPKTAPETAPKIVLNLKIGQSKSNNQDRTRPPQLQVAKPSAEKIVTVICLSIG
jgi:hypothetical protein